MKKFCLCIALLFIGALVLGCAPDGTTKQGTWPTAASLSNSDVDMASTLIKLVDLADYDFLNLLDSDTYNDPETLPTVATSRAVGDYSFTVDGVTAVMTMTDGLANAIAFDPTKSFDTATGDVIVYDDTALATANSSTLSAFTGVTTDANGDLSFGTPTATAYTTCYVPALFWRIVAQEPVTQTGVLSGAFASFTGDSITNTTTGLLAGFSNDPYNAVSSYLGYVKTNVLTGLVTRWPQTLEFTLSGTIGPGTINALYDRILVTNTGAGVAGIEPGSAGSTISLPDGDIRIDLTNGNQVRVTMAFTAYSSGYPDLTLTATYYVDDTAVAELGKTIVIDFDADGTITGVISGTGTQNPAVDLAPVGQFEYDMEALDDDGNTVPSGTYTDLATGYRYDMGDLGM